MTEDLDRLGYAADFVKDSIDYRTPDAKRDYGQKSVHGQEDEGLAADYRVTGLEK